MSPPAPKKDHKTLTFDGQCKKTQILKNQIETNALKQMFNQVKRWIGANL